MSNTIKLTNAPLQGVKAENGKNIPIGGYTFTPAVSAEGVISWTNDGNLENPTPVNIKGVKGDKGDRGFSGVYVGNGDMPDGYNVQIDPSGTTTEVDDLKADLGKIDNIELYQVGKSDLDIADENGNVIARFKDGNITTKNFDSSNHLKKPYNRVNRFTVTVDGTKIVNNNYDSVSINSYTQPVFYEDNAVLYLPDSYNRTGTPTKLIIFCKHGSSQITSESDPVFNLNIFNYMLNLGYAILSADGMPDALSENLSLDDTRVVGNYVSIQSVIKAYEYVINNYNIDCDGAYIFGYSQGGMFAENVVDLSGIPFKATALLSPVLSMRYHQWDLYSNVTVNGVNYTYPARLNIARLFGFDNVSNNTELTNLEYDDTKVCGFDPWIRNVEEPYIGFVKTGNLWKLSSETLINDIKMKKYIDNPTKIWCAENDNALSVDVMKVFAKAVRNNGQICELKVYQTGGHSIFNNQTAIGTFIENSEIHNLYPLAFEIGNWFGKFGGYRKDD